MFAVTQWGDRHAKGKTRSLWFFHCRMGRRVAAIDLSPQESPTHALIAHSNFVDAESFQDVLEDRRPCEKDVRAPFGKAGKFEPLHLRQRARQEASILQQLTSGRERIRCRVRPALVMGAAAIGVTEKEDEEQGID